MTEVVFPLLDEDAPQAPGVVSTWFFDDGARLPAGALLAEVQVTKIAGEVMAPAEGILRRKVAEGEVVRQGSVIATID